MNWRAVFVGAQPLANQAGRIYSPVKFIASDIALFLAETRQITRGHPRRCPFPCRINHRRQGINGTLSSQRRIPLGARRIRSKGSMARLLSRPQTFKGRFVSRTKSLHHQSLKSRILVTIHCDRFSITHVWQRFPSSE